MRLFTNYSQKEELRIFEQYDDIITIDELIEMLKIGRNKAYELLSSGKIKAYKEGKDWKILKQSVINYIVTRSNLTQIGLGINREVK